MGSKAGFEHLTNKLRGDSAIHKVTPEHIARLRLHDACRDISPDELQEIAAHVEVIHLPLGATIHSAGQKIEALSIVIEGRLRVSHILPNGDHSTVRFIPPGDVFGAVMLASEEDDFQLEVTVDERATLFQIQKETARQIINRIPAFRRNLLRKIGLGVRDAVLGNRRSRSRSRVIAFVHSDQWTRRLVLKIVSRLTELGESIGILSDVGKQMFLADVPVKNLRDQDDEYIDAEELQRTIEEWPELNRIVIVADRACPIDKLNRVCELSDKVFCLTRTSNVDSTISQLKHLTGAAPSWKKKMQLLWVLKEDEPVAPRVPGLAELTNRDFKTWLTDSQSSNRMELLAIERVIHYLRGFSVGLALSGGAAHGMAHLGVLRALDEAGITVDEMAGTSAGVLTGVLYCAGRTPEWAANQFANDLKPSDFLRWFPRGDGLYMLGKYRTHSWDPMLRKYLFDWSLEQLPIPITTLTTDLISAQSIQRRHGDAVDAILESINLPVLSPPICRDGMLLVDGGFLNNLPGDVLVNRGCDLVIGVDVAANIEHRLGDNFPDTPKEKMKVPGIATTLMRCYRVQAHNMSNQGARSVDIMIAPDVSRFESTAFSEAVEMADVGYRETQDAMPRITNLLQNLDQELFSA